MAVRAKDKFTKQEKSWILYDWANSVYATNIMAAIFPIYFTAVCGGDTARGRCGRAAVSLTAPGRSRRPGSW